MSDSAKAHSEIYQVTPRTISRWRAASVNTSDLVSVAEHLLKLRHPSPAAMRAVHDLLLADLLQPQSITR
jgi:hypothetical protein